MNWDQLTFWNTGEWQVIEEKLDDLTDQKVVFNPDRKNLFKALATTPLEDCKVALFGQDPYPSHTNSTGLAFSIPARSETFPPTLQEVFREYQSDLGYEAPKTGDLTPWAEQGVLLWNVIPTTLLGKSLAHEWWTEWSYLTKEITEELSKRGIVFALLGSKARQYKQFIDEKNNKTIETSHPSPRGSLNSKTPFVGSRLFSRINDYLVQQGKTTVNWRLP